MKFTFKKLTLITTIIGSLAISACSSNDKTTVNKPQNLIKVGVMFGSEFLVADKAKQVAKNKYGLDVELVEFTDYVAPNEALNRGDIDLNAFQHKPFLDEQINARGYKLVPVANTIVNAMAGYSKKIKSIDGLNKGDTIAIPNDPTNLGRSLLLLEKQGLIKLQPGKGLMPTVLDIIDNPKKLKILELNAPQLPLSLDNPKITIAVINTAYLSQIGLTPTKDGIFVEGKDSPYVNLIVARENNKDNENVKTFIKAFQSDEVFAVANKEFQGSVIKGW